MEISGFNENEVSEHGKEAMKPETWQKMREAMKADVMHFTEAPEIQHIAMEKFSKNDNAYGITWGNLVCEYLKTAYSGESTQAEIVSDGVAYKVLKREKVTVFYDADGNTLFDVENKRLEKEYEWVMNSSANTDAGITNPENEENNFPIAGTEADENIIPAKEKVTELPVSTEEAAVGKEEVAQSAKQRAKEKLEKEMKADKDKSFAEPVIGYLLERCTEDEGLAQDVLQEHKTWKKCFDYIYSQARKQSKGNCTAVRDEVVFEWAEDYYHKDDKAEEEKKAKQEAERKAKQKKEVEERKTRAKEKSAKKAPVTKKKEKLPKEQPNPKRSNKDMEGQLDMFSMMGM